MIDPRLLEIVVCPQCRSVLAADATGSELACTDVECGLVYPVREGVPVLLVDHAQPPRDRPPEDERGH